jgi:glutamyl/glutaminyl-tRNA synthetase
VEEKLLQDPSKVKDHISFYFKDEVKVDPAMVANPKMKVDVEIAKKGLEAIIKALEDFDGFDEQEKIKNRLMEVIAGLGLKNGQVLWPARVALTGEQFSPGVFEVIWALGKEKALIRLKRAVNTL